MSDQQKRGGGFSSLLKNLFFLILILQFAPSMLQSLKKSFKDIVTPRTPVGFLTVSGGISDSGYYIRQIHKFLEDESIDGLILKIESPGGYAGSPQAIFEELQLFRKKKPIVAMVENVAASAAYYIAAAANDIVANPSSMIGSIGSFVRVPNVKGLAEDWKIKVDIISAGKYKAVGHPFKDLTPADIEMLTSYNNDAYRQFAQDVAGARHLDISNKDDWAEGRVFTGSQAKKAGLVDKLGSITVAKETLKTRLKEYGKEPYEKLRLVVPPAPSPFEQLFKPQIPGSFPENMASLAKRFVSTLLMNLGPEQG